MKAAMKTAWPLALVAAFALRGAAADDDVAGEDVRFATADGLTIAATWYPPAAGTPAPAPVVVALPMYRHTRRSYASLVRPVTDRGMGLLALDLRGHGDSAKQGDADLSKRVDDRDPALFNAMHQDVEAAIAWLAKEKKTPKGKVALVGASVGCSVAIDTAVRAPEDVAAVACLTPGKDYLGVPTMDHVAKWPNGRPLLLVSCAGEIDGGAGPILAKLEGRGAEMKRVEWAKPDETADERSLHGTNMFGRVDGVEDNLADWLALHAAFRRVDLGDGVVAVIGSLGGSLYVGIETPAGSNVSTQSLAVRFGLGPVTDPWSKSETIAVGARLAANGESTRRRTKIPRERLGAEAGRAFAVAVSLDGKKFLPEAGEPQLLVALR
jgi:dienelactone hydrolase